MTQSEHCETCRFFDPLEGPDSESLGWCRRYPPVYIGDEQHTRAVEDEFRQPIVDAVEFCGEHQAAYGAGV